VPKIVEKENLLTAEFVPGVCIGGIEMPLDKWSL
jgi:hypothetical protein